jgi:hypothetical protein
MMAQRYTMCDNGDATYNIDDDEMGATIVDRGTGAGPMICGIM